MKPSAWRPLNGQLNNWREGDDEEEVGESESREVEEKASPKVGSLEAEEKRKVAKNFSPVGKLGYVPLDIGRQSE